MQCNKSIFKLLIIFLSFVQSASFSQVSWQQVYTSTSAVQCLARVSNYFYTGTLGNDVIISSDSGLNWIASNNGLTSLHVYSIIITGNKIYVGVGSPLGSSGGVFVSTDNGLNWSPTGLTNKDVRCKAISGNNIFVGTKGTGAFLSTDSGLNWKAINDGLPNLTLSDLVIKGSIIFAATSEGVFRSMNNGTSWAPANFGLTYINTNCFLISQTDIYVGTKDGGVFRSLNDGNSWKEVNTNLIDLNILGFGNYDNKVFLGYSKGVAFTADKGIGWIEKGLKLCSVNSFAFNENYIFTGSSIGVHIQW
ncbi:MAG: hypothetical protein N3A61_03105 [Ignavibacteria bacterium]|nr:hypothetical protein [Ignavibacteria bacterium]